MACATFVQGMSRKMRRTVLDTRHWWKCCEIQRRMAGDSWQHDAFYLVAGVRLVAGSLIICNI